MGLQKITDHNFDKPQILEEALTHSSYVNENKAAHINHNERLEYLGDAVLELIVSSYIFDHFPTMSEGDMTRLRAGVVCEPSLATCAKKINLGVHLKMGKGEVANGGRERDSVLSDAFEAVIGAIYLDGGYEAAQRFVLTHLEGEIHSLKGLKWISDCKTHLQEQLQKDSQEPIEYKVIKEEGPEHEKIFTVELTHGGRFLGKGSGRNKKEAEQAAARFAIEENHFY